MLLSQLSSSGQPLVNTLLLLLVWSDFVQERISRPHLNVYSRWYYRRLSCEDEFFVRSPSCVERPQVPDQLGNNVQRERVFLLHSLDLFFPRVRIAKVVRIICGVFYFDIIRMLAMFVRVTAVLVADKTGPSLYFLSSLSPWAFREVTVSALQVSYLHRFTSTAIQSVYVSVQRSFTLPTNSTINTECDSSTFQTYMSAHLGLQLSHYPSDPQKSDRLSRLIA